MESLPPGSDPKHDSHYWEFYCPLCRVQLRSLYWPQPQKRHYFGLAVASLVLTMVLWPWCGVKGVFPSILLWSGFEFYYRARARQSLICRHCGFDPFLYKFDVRLARQKVEAFWAEKQKRRQMAALNRVAPEAASGPSSS